MVDKFFKSVFSTIDSTLKLDPLSLVGIKSEETKQAKETPARPITNLDKTIMDHQDRSLCIIHKQKKEFFCQECSLELCIQCRDKHPSGHTIRFQEETSNSITASFQEGRYQVKELRGKLSYAAKRDPTEIKSDESVSALDHGNKLIDDIYEKIYKAVNNSKMEMKERFKESYKANYKSTIQKKSQSFLQQLDKLNNYIEMALRDFESLQSKGKHARVCVQRQKVDDLGKNLKKFDDALSRMVQRALEFRSDYQILFQQTNFDEELRSLFNRHINVTFPGLEEGVFQVRQNNNRLGDLSYFSERPNYVSPLPIKKSYSPSSNSESDFPNFDESHVQNQQLSTSSNVSLSIDPKIIQSDSRFELKTLKFMRDKFVIKLYDTQNKKGSSLDVYIPENIARIPNRYFGYVSIGQSIIMAGGQYIEQDKSCSSDTFKFGINKQSLKDLQASMQVARMHHSMMYIEEQNFVLAIGGEDDHGTQLDSCEMYCTKENQWKSYSQLNNRGKNMGVCKFIVENKKDMQIYVYAFGRYFIERSDVTKTPMEPRWEELNVKISQPLPASPNLFQFDDHLIVISGGVSEQNQSVKDVLLYNPLVNKIEKQFNSNLQMVDKFMGGSMTQCIMNRLDQKIYFCSESFVHEAEYGGESGQAKLKFNATIY